MDRYMYALREKQALNWYADSNQGSLHFCSLEQQPVIYAHSRGRQKRVLCSTSVFTPVAIASLINQVNWSNSFFWVSWSPPPPPFQIEKDYAKSLYYRIIGKLIIGLLKRRLRHCEEPLPNSVYFSAFLWQCSKDREEADRIQFFM